MKVDMGVGPNEKGENSIIITVKSPLLNRYFENFKHVIEENEREVKGLPEGLKVLESVNSGEAIITFPIKDSQIDPDTALPNRRRVKLNEGQMNSLNYALNLWVSLAARLELSSVEFIPLHGYSADDLKKDIQEAVANKRDLCIIKTYKEYLDSQNAKSAKDAFTFVQYIVRYGTDEYSNVAISLYNKELKNLRDTYEAKLVRTEWI